MTRGLALDGQAPLAVHWRLVRNGKVIDESTGRTLRFSVAEPGNYRAEAWLDIAEERMLWILSNPLYIQAPSERGSVHSPQNLDDEYDRKMTTER
jgi:hypothetical protein